MVDERMEYLECHGFTQIYNILYLLELYYFLNEDLNMKLCLVNLHVGSKHLKDVFHRMGLSDKDIVALSGAHTLVNSLLHNSY